jgi:hypothetical protein
MALSRPKGDQYKASSRDTGNNAHNCFKSSSLWSTTPAGKPLAQATAAPLELAKGEVPCRYLSSLDPGQGHTSKRAPDFCLPTKSATVPDGPDWLHEVKYDGYPRLCLSGPVRLHHECLMLTQEQTRHSLRAQIAEFQRFLF